MPLVVSSRPFGGRRGEGPEAEIERLKQRMSLASLVEAGGIELRRGYYHRVLTESPEALEYLRRRKIDQPEHLAGSLVVPVVDEAGW
jgi:hypothetical protein